MDIYFCIWVCRTDENPKADSQTDGMKHKRAVYWGGCPEYKNTKNQNVKGRQKLTEPKVEKKWGLGHTALWADILSKGQRESETRYTQEGD